LSNQTLDTGVVTAVDVSANGSFVLGGFEDGSIVVWDIKRDAIVRTLEPLNHVSHRHIGHARGAAILHIAFVGDQNHEFIAADNQVSTYRIYQQYNADKFSY
jgi:WD40 repeat protein